MNDKPNERNVAIRYKREGHYLVECMPLRIQRRNGSIKQQIAHIKQLVILQAMRFALCRVRLDIVKLSKAAGKLDMALVIESGFTKDEHTILSNFSMSF